MSNRDNLLEQLSTLLAWKKSKSFMAEKLDISIEELNQLLIELRSIERPNVIRREELSEADLMLIDKGLEEGYVVEGGWLKEKGMSLRFSKVENALTQESFQDFLKTYVPAATPIVKESNPHLFKVNSCLIINKQDAHLNKYDIDGDNNIQKRFSHFYEAVSNILTKAKCTSNLQKVIYILGSDEFNSEWTGRTIHDTPQQNILSYQESFEAICKHEISIINLLAERADNVHVLYVPGNHDEHVGWHMVNWLKTYYRNCSTVHFDGSPSHTKYVKYSNTGLCFNHGYVVKPETLAANFPVEFKEHWSACDHFAIFAGDKHTELSRTIGGIKFYRLAAISKSKSKWDSERGYGLCQGELTAFLIEEGEGVTDVYYKKI